MKTIYFKWSLGVVIATLSHVTFADFRIGDPKSSTGELTFSGTLRGNYHDKDFGESTTNDRKIKFDAGIFRIGYDSPQWLAKAEYRCYQYDKLCDFSTLVYAYAGYKLNDTDQLTVGLQPIPFGPGRFWDSSFYASINNTIGLQDILNLGVNYHVEFAEATKVDLAYFAQDGGHYKGDSVDAARYTANFIHSADPNQTNLNEKNMWLMRVNQDLNFFTFDDFKASVGASYWYSEIENKTNAQQGSRKAWTLFSQMEYKNAALTLTGGKLSIDNKDPVHPDYSMIGAFDTEYELANKGNFYTLDARYTFKQVKDDLNISPYLVYSGYDKSNKSDHDSKRHIAGVAWDYKNISFYTEYIMSKNDPFIGGTSSSLAAGDDNKWNKMLNLTFIYNF
ncbi:hypothetical protein [Acinetobacter bereziniae]|uniref:hypothetical protein n=1 Tax=Acinetobacter bereziniae TaxID=106648 RepID=UPI00374E2233